MASVDQELPEEVCDVVLPVDLVRDHHEADRCVVVVDTELDRAAAGLLLGLLERLGNGVHEPLLPRCQPERNEFRVVLVGERSEVYGHRRQHRTGVEAAYDRGVADLPAGTVTFAFTDIEDSTELLKRLGDDYRDVLTTHRRIIRDAFGASDGIEMDTQGDAFFFVFPRARDAVAAAVEAQRAHVAAAWPGEEEVRVRMGLHTGEPAIHEEGYVGLDVVRAARICTVGRGGQILLSETTRALLGSGLPDGVSVFPLGQRHLRGIDEPERVFEVAIEGLEREANASPDEEPGAAPTPPEPPPPPAPPAPTSGDDFGADIARRFEDLGTRLAAGIQERVLGSLGGTAGASSGVDDIAERMAALGDEIDARVNAALAKKGVPPSDG